MTVVDYRASQIIDSIRNLTMLPTQTEGTEDSDILRHINEALKVSVSELVSIREEYYIRREKTAITSKVRYRIPHRAYLNKLRDIYYWDSSGDRCFLGRIEPELLYRYNDSTASEPVGYFVEGNDIVLVPDISSSFTGYIEFVYPFRPGDLVLSTTCRQITNVNTSTKTVTFGSDVPSTWGLTDEFDIHSQNSGAEIKLWDLTPSTCSGNQIVFNEAIDGSVFGTTAPSVGDWVCLAEECAIPGLPRDLIPTLIRATALRLSEAETDGAAFQLHASHLTEEKRRHLKAMENRVESCPIRIKGRRGILRSM